MLTAGFSRRLYELRKERGLSTRELGRLIGVDSGRISRYENDGKRPFLDSAARLSNALNVSLDYLCGYEDEKRPAAGPYSAELFPVRLKELQRRSGLPKQTLSELCGFDKDRVGRYLIHHDTPRIEVVASFAEFFGVPMEYFCL